MVDNVQEQVADLLFPAQGESPAKPQPEVSQVPELPETVQPEATTEDEAPEQEAEPAEMPDTLEALAEKSGLKVKDLYKVKIPMPDGEEPITLGQFKDRLKDLSRADTLSAEAEDQKATLQAERLQFQQELAVVTQALQAGGKLSEDSLRKAAANMQQYQQQQRALAEKIAPELGKAEVVDGMAKMVEKYGVTRAYFDQIHEAPFRLMMHRLFTLEQRLEAAKAKETKARVAKPQPKQSLSGKERQRSVVSAVQAGQMPATQAAAKLIFGD
jgi:hypothetical protein